MDAPRILVRIEGRLRDVPLAPVVVLAESDAALALARRALETLNEPDAPRLLGVAAREPVPLVALLGPSEELPWVDGARYFGIEPGAPRLRLSTTHGPAIDDGTVLPSALLERALVAQLGATAKGPFVVTTRAGNPHLISLATARPIEASLLRAFLGERRDGGETEPRS